jgi:putative phosphoesterase
MKILVIADIHGNAEALSAVLEKEQDADSTVFLGDVALPGPQPNETIALLHGLSGTLIQGNHDIDLHDPEQFAKWPDTWRALMQWGLDTLDESGYAFIENLKPEGEYTEGGIRMLLHHGVLPDRPQQALPDTPDERLALLANDNDSPFVLFGHSHVQFRRTINGQEFINPGSVGQSRCGKRLACYGLFEDGVFRHCQTEYDPAPWLESMDRIAPLDAFPVFRDQLKNDFIRGYGIGKTEPWTRYAQEGYV